MGFRAQHRREDGNAVLMALLVLAASAGVVALQARTLELQSQEELLDARSEKARRFATMAMGHAADLLARGDLEVRCAEDGATLGFRDAAMQRRHAGRIKGSRMSFSHCDPDTLTDKDRAALYVGGGLPPSRCRAVHTTVTFDNIRCGKNSLADVELKAHTSLDLSPQAIALNGNARSTVELRAKLPVKGQCAYQCHVTPDGKMGREKKPEAP